MAEISLTSLIKIVGEVNTLAGGIAVLAGTIRALRAQGHDLPPTPTLDALLDVYERRRGDEIEAIDEWMRAHGRDPATTKL